jgi:hypothetical protein
MGLWSPSCHPPLVQLLLSWTQRAFGALQQLPLLLLQLLWELLLLLLLRLQLLHRKLQLLL